MPLADIDAHLKDASRRRAEDWMRHLAKIPAGSPIGWNDRFGLKALYL